MTERHGLGAKKKLFGKPSFLALEPGFIIIIIILSEFRVTSAQKVLGRRRRIHDGY